MDKLVLKNGTYELMEKVSYVNGGCSFLYVLEDTAIVLDQGICRAPENPEEAIEYSKITGNQNNWMCSYRHFYRFLMEDVDRIDAFLELQNEIDDTAYITKKHGTNRSETSDPSPLEWHFEQSFQKVYGSSALKYLNREYVIADPKGNEYFLDYVVETTDGLIAIEENGVNYHHPQIIKEARYRYQLRKQNVCALWGIRLYRFSSEDIVFDNRMEDDIRRLLGRDTSRFIENGIRAERSFHLYEHQENALEEIRKRRKEGVKAFLQVAPTASGKSKIVEEDLNGFAEESSRTLRALVLAPGRNTVDDWKERAENIACSVDVYTYSYMERHYREYDPEYYDYICVDEAHHAVAPMLKKVIQYFDPQFLIGLTATDQRPDHKKLEEVFGSYNTNLSLEDAMDQGIIAEANVYRIETNLDLSEVRFNGHEYVNADLEKYIRITSRNELIADVLQQYFSEGRMAEKQGVVFCINREHAKEMEKTLNSFGLSAKAYIGSDSHSDQVMKEFKEHKIRFLCAVQMISEGWDYPELGILVMARPTMSKVLYVQQLGRGLRKTQNKDNVFVIDVVDEYSALVRPITMASVFHNAFYTPWMNARGKNYKTGDMIIVEGITEQVERIIPVDTYSFEEKYTDYLNQEQLAREFFFTTGTITSWVKKKKIVPDVEIPFGSHKIWLFSPDNVKKIREENEIAEHTEETIKEDFFTFLEERDYSLSYKMPFLLSLMKHLNEAGEAKIADVVDDYIAFYEDRIKKGLPIDRRTCPYTAETLKDRKFIQRNMLTNPFEKFERKRFMYYSKNLGMIALNPALFGKLNAADKDQIVNQMNDDLKSYYERIS